MQQSGGAPHSTSSRGFHTSPEEDEVESEDHTFATNRAVPADTQGGSNSQNSTSDDDDTSLSSYKSDTTWPDIELPGTWGSFGLEEDPWNEDTKPVVRLKNYEDLELTEQEQNGVLTERIMACCSSYLDRSPEIGKYVLCKTNLSGKNLQDISILTYHHYLQFVNLSHNQLTCLKPLGQLPFLMYLDASHNILTEVLNFKPPINLTYVNFSHNYVDVIDDLSGFWSLVFLNLSHNQIYYIKGLEKLKYLRYLDLSFNQIKELRSLNRMKLVHLDLQNNRIDRIIIEESEGLHTLKDLVGINLSNNSIKSLRLFENVDALQKIVMTGNKIKHLIELEHLKNLMFLTEVDFKGNPICSQKKYYEMCIKLIKPLVTLDGAYITSEEKVMVQCKHDPPPLLEAARRRANLLILEKLMKYEVSDTTLPVSKPVPPIMILVGPPGGGQRALLTQFANKRRRYLKVGVSHTTRPKRDFEEEAVDFYFISDDHFKNLTKEGEFMSISEYMGYSYGFCRDELLKVYNQKLILILHTDLISALTLRMKSLRPILILALCFEKEKHYESLVNTLCYAKWSTCFKEKSDIFRLATTGIASLYEQPSSGSQSTKELFEDVVSYMPPTKEKQVAITFDANHPASSSVSRGSTTVSRDDTLRSTTSPKKFTSVSFHSDEKSEKAVRSISDQEMGLDPPVLSVLSEYVIVTSDSESSVEPPPFKPQEHIEKFIKEVMETRRQYIEFHRDNPGFFLDVVFTDREQESLSKLTAVLKNLVQKKKEPFHPYSYEKDPCFEEMLTERLNILYTEMYSEMCVSEDQQPKCWREHTIDDLQ